MLSVSVTAMQRAVTLTKPHGYVRVSGVEVCVTAFTTPAAGTANTARAASTETQRAPRLPRTPADLACVTVLVPHIVTLIMETASVSRGWLDHTVTSACWDSGVSMNMVASPASVLVTVTLTQETV